MKHMVSITYQVKCTGYSRDGVSFPTERTVSYVVGNKYALAGGGLETINEITLNSSMAVPYYFNVCFTNGYILEIPLTPEMEVLYKDDEPTNLTPNGDI